MTTSIEAQGLVKTYPGNVKALDGLTFGVEGGSVFALLGPNGAGKSTTVKILSTLSRPNAGSARINGVDVAREPDRVRRLIGVVAQRSGVDREATGRENLRLQGQIYGIPGRQLNARIDELLERFDLTAAANRVSRTYSGGMQRKLDVAMGLVHRPKVVFLDEPTTGLDPEARAELWNEIHRLTQLDGLTILLTTHYLEEADRLARQIAIVDRGRIVAQGTPDQLKGELRGDAIRVELAGSNHHDQAIHALAGLAGLRDVAFVDGALHARADRGATAVPAVLAALDAAGLGVAAVTVARPSLDDVYLRHTGRTFDHTAQGAAA